MTTSPAPSPARRRRSTTLRTRVLLSSAALVTFGALTAVAVGAVVVMGGFRSLEHQDAQDDLERAAAALRSDVDNMSALALDWAAWDDTYAFVSDPIGHVEYAESNLLPSTFLGQGLDLIAMTNQAGAVQYAGVVDVETEQFLPAEPLVTKLSDLGLLASFTDSDGSRAGLALVDGRVIEVAVRPVTSSDQTSPPNGTLTMARWLTDDIVANLSDRTRLDIAITADGDTPPEDRAVTTTSDDITARAPLLGVQGESVAQLSVSQPRSITSEGRRSVVTMVAVVVGVLGIAGALLLVVSDVQALRPLRRLGREINLIGTTGDSSGRVTNTRRDDEIGRVATHLNDTLGALQRVKQDLELRNLELEQANKARRRFLSVVSHDLRGPLTSILGFGALLTTQWESLSELQRRDFVSRIDRQATNIETMVGDLMTLAQLEQGHLAATPAVIESAQLLSQVVDDLPEPHDDVVLTDVGVSLHVDPVHARRIVINLIDNARKYGAPPVEVSAVAVDAHAEITVRDHGAGVPDEFVQVMFDAFSQAEAGEASTGIGLGLSIVRELAAANGGSVRYEQPPGSGASFIVSLPAPAQDKATETSRDGHVPPARAKR